MPAYEVTSAEPTGLGRDLRRRTVSRFVLAALATLAGWYAMDDGYRKVGHWFGGAFQHALSALVLHVLPVVALAVCGAFYVSEIRRAVRRNMQAHRAGPEVSRDNVLQPAPGHTWHPAHLPNQGAHGGRLQGGE